MARPPRHRSALLVALVLALGTAACNDSKTAASLTYTEDAYAAYKEAMKAFEEKDWEDARALFEEVKRLFSSVSYTHLTLPTKRIV